MENSIDSGSALLMSLAMIFMVAAGNFVQTNFLDAVICAGVAIVCIVAREWVKK